MKGAGEKRYEIRWKGRPWGSASGDSMEAAIQHWLGSYPEHVRASFKREDITARRVGR